MELGKDVTAKDILDKVRPDMVWGSLRNGKYEGDCFCSDSSDSNTRFRVFNNGFKCFKCDKKGGVLDLVVELINDVKNRETARKWVEDNFVNKGDPKLNKKTTVMKNATNKVNYELNAKLYKAAYEYGKESLTKQGTELAQQVLNYLTSERKYTVEKIASSDFFVMPNREEVTKFLVKKFPEDKEYILNEKWGKDEKGKSIKIGLKLKGGFEETLSLGIPYRNKKGEILGFVYRSIEPKGETVTKRSYSKDKVGKTIHEDEIKEKCRYDSTQGLPKGNVIFGIHKCVGEKKVVIVEGYPDAVYLGLYNDINICAIGSGALGKAHIRSLVNNGIEEIILSLDNDLIKDKDKGKSKLEQYRLQKKRIFDAIGHLELAGISTFIIEPRDLGESKDLDELYRNQGIGEVKSVLTKAKSMIDYLVFTLEREYEILQNENEKESISLIKDRFFDLCQLLKTENSKENFLEIVSEKFKEQGLSRAVLELELKFLKEDFAITQENFVTYLEGYKNRDEKLYSFFIQGLTSILPQFEEVHSSRIKKITTTSFETRSIPSFLSKKGLKLGVLNLKLKLTKNRFEGLLNEAKNATIHNIQDLNQLIKEVSESYNDLKKTLEELSQSS